MSYLVYPKQYHRNFSIFDNYSLRFTVYLNINRYLNNIECVHRIYVTRGINKLNRNLLFCHGKKKKIGKNMCVTHMCHVTEMARQAKSMW